MFKLYIYILPRIPMIAFKFYNIDRIDAYLYFGMSFIATIIFVAIFNKLTKMIKLEKLLKYIKLTCYVK